MRQAPFAPHPSRRSFLLAAGAISHLALPLTTLATTRPATARIVVGIPPGGPGDMMARTLARKMQGSYAPVVIVENRPGAATQLAITAVRNAPADGAQLLLTPSSPLSLCPYTYKALPYRPEEDFVAVAGLGSANHAFAVGPMVSAQVKNLGDYIRWAKDNPLAASFGSSASGSIPHLLGTAVGHFRGVALTHVAYKGSTPGLQDLMGGQISAMVSPIGFFLPMLERGKVRVLAVSGDERSRFLPAVATFREQQVPVTAREWYGLFMPAKTLPEWVQAAEASVIAALGDGELAAQMAKYGLDIRAHSGEQLRRMLQADTQEWKGVVGTMGFTAES